MIDTETLEAALRGLSPAKDAARIELLVRRLRDEGRQTPATAILDPERGLVGDKWASGKKNPATMVTLMRWDFASLLVPGPAILGDNLFAAIDTSNENLPAGTIVQVGAARCVVTPKPHTGCSKFSARAGADALALTKSDRWKPHNLRGVHLRVLDRGEVTVGGEIRVLSRP